jgi:hypothetical protein
MNHMKGYWLEGCVKGHVKGDVWGDKKLHLETWERGVREMMKGMW